MKKMLPSKEDHQQCKINGLEYLISFYNLCPLIISSSFYFYLNSHHMSSPRPSPSLGFTRRHIFASPRLRSVRRPVFASSVAPSSLRPSPRFRFACSLVFAFLSPFLQFALSSPRLCGIVVFCKM
ncbi:hypothetical protein OUZ56_027169 [Daphnia magna]|uniref:Transmembrane protein n=1 Tax=Daphnia magna TaxID=35525 RepID=A0ABQ9ZPN4_9CRUS|nr:hypothetical protein OUZ56_027169 [Daphnia magna]